MPEYEQLRTAESPTTLPLRRMPDGTTHVRNAALAAMRILLVLGAVTLAKGQDAPEKKQAEGVHSVQTERERWTQDRLSTIQESLRRSVLKLNDDLFAVRQEGSGEILETINMLLGDVNPPPPEVTEIFENLHAKVKAGDLSLEQRVRLTFASEHVHDSMAEKPDRIPPLRYAWKECLLAISEQTGFSVDTSGIEAEMLQSTIDVRPGSNDCFKLLGEFCRVADMTPEFGTDRGVIRLVKRREGSSTRLAGEGKLLAIAKENENGRVSVDVRMSPRAGRLVAIKNVVSGDKNTGDVNIGDHPVPAWTFRNVGSPSAHAGQATFAPASPWISAECTVVQHAETIRLTKDGEGGRVGFQNFRVVEPNPEQPKRIQVNAWVFGDVPWPATPCDVDSKTYGAGAASTFRPRNAAGKLIPGRVVSCEVDQRLMIFTIECDEVPSSVDITAYREFTLEKKMQIEMP